jgi:hypothetical protein
MPDRRSAASNAPNLPCSSSNSAPSIDSGLQPPVHPSSLGEKDKAETCVDQKSRRVGHASLMSCLALLPNRRCADRPISHCVLIRGGHSKACLLLQIKNKKLCGGSEIEVLVSPTGTVHRDLEPDKAGCGGGGAQCSPVAMTGVALRMEGSGQGGGGAASAVASSALMLKLARRKLLYHLRSHAAQRRPSATTPS